MNRRRILWALIAAVSALALWAFVIELNLLSVTQAEIRLPALPPAFDGTRIVAIADIHGGSRFTGPGKIARVVRAANEQNPDFIFLLGDYVTGNIKKTPNMSEQEIAKLLAPLHARYGVYAILGNHDWWVSGTRGVSNALKSAGIHLIDDQIVPIEKDGARIWLAGIPDLWIRKRHDFTSLIPNTGFIIGLTHNPDVFPVLQPPIPLLFAGHTHGGQVRLPFIGRPIVPSSYGQRYAAGLIEENGRHLYVTTGVGTSILPVRFGVPPEIAVVTLRR